MPTTQDEASRIVSISQEYLPIEKMAEMFVRLDAEVGQVTTNDSLKQSLAMMQKLVASIPKEEERETSVLLWLTFYLLVTFHAFLVIGMAFSFIILPFAADWYIAIPTCTFIWFFSTSRIECKLTDAENNLRKQLGMKRIGGFVGHYFFRPIRKMMIDSR